ncbi:hypothetical protein ABT294_03325 [Nonomuraea sp. NPDC000554]|uniref:hypothetical protein n=1 Tax=Nonomuraea sp. NPDC000554 TaxID=3154259 RepID=UPI00331F4E2C
MPTVTTSDEARMRAALHEAFERDLALLAPAAARPGGGDAQTRARWAWFKYFLLVHQRTDQTYLWPVLSTKAARTDLALLELLAEERQTLAALIGAIDTTLEFPLAPDRVWAAFSNLVVALARHHRHETRLAEGAAGLLTSTERVELYWERRRLTGLKGAGYFYPWLLDGAPDTIRDSVLTHLPPTDRLLYRTLWQPRYVRANTSDSSLERRCLS